MEELTGPIATTPLSARRSHSARVATSTSNVGATVTHQRTNFQAAPVIQSSNESMATGYGVGYFSLGDAGSVTSAASAADVQAARHEANQLRLELRECRAKLETQARHYLDQLNESVRLRDTDQMAFERQLQEMQSEVNTMREQCTAHSSQSEVKVWTEASFREELDEASFREELDKACAQAVKTKLDDVNATNRKRIAEKNDEIASIRAEMHELEAKYRAKIVTKDEEIANLSARMEKMELDCASRDMAMNAEKSMYKSQLEQIQVHKVAMMSEINQKHKSVHADAREEFRQREEILRAVYWEEFQAVKEEMYRATRMTKIVEDRYKERVKLFKKDLACLWDDAMLHVKKDLASLWDDAMLRASVEARSEDITSVRVHSHDFESLQIMRERFEREVDRRCTQKLHAGHGTLVTVNVSESSVATTTSSPTHSDTTRTTQYPASFIDERALSLSPVSEADPPEDPPEG